MVESAADARARWTAPMLHSADVRALQLRCDGTQTAHRSGVGACRKSGGARDGA